MPRQSGGAFLLSARGGRLVRPANSGTAYLKELIEYWHTKYDWRRHESEMNSYANYKTELDGMPISFHPRTRQRTQPHPAHPDARMALDFLGSAQVIRPLTDPAAFGGDPRDSFDVVVPSLPGYGFSTPLTTTGINYWKIADLWVKLMPDVLGYKKLHGRRGGDWGAIVTAQLGHKLAA